jgi:hypothetical protein
MVQRIVAALGAAGFIFGLFFMLRFDSPPRDADSGKAEPRPKNERVGIAAPDWLSKTGSALYVGTVSHVQNRRHEETEFGTRVTGTVELWVEKTMLGESCKTLTLNFDWRHLSEDKEILFHEWQTEWGRHPLPREGMRMVIMLAPQSIGTGERDFPCRATMIWELPEYNYLIPSLEALTEFLNSRDDKMRLDAFAKMCQIDSKNIRYFGYNIAILAQPDHPWCATEPGARRAIAIRFMTSLAPFTRNGSDYGYCEPWNLSREFATMLAMDTDLAKMVDARAVAVDWLWGELAATGSQKLEWDTTRRVAAVHGLEILRKKRGAAWVNALFESKNKPNSSTG